jgi:DNA-binding MarR family transcriptional regulator
VRKGIDDQGLPDHLLRWLDAATRRVQTELFASYGRPENPRPSQRRILSLITEHGARITDLAVRAGMTKQAVGEVIDALEEAGLVTSGGDPHDGRVRLVRRTRRGDTIATRTGEAITTVEAQLRAEVGPERYDVMKQVLREIGRRSYSTSPGATPIEARSLAALSRSRSRG